MKSGSIGAGAWVTAAVLMALAPGAAVPGWAAATSGVAAPLLAPADPDPNDPDPNDPDPNDPDPNDPDPADSDPDPAEPTADEPDDEVEVEEGAGQEGGEPAGPTLDVTPPWTVAGSTVVLSGGCSPGTREAELDLPPGWQAEGATVQTQAESASARLPVPPDASGGTYTVTLTCDGITVSTDLEVLAAPDLRLDPVSGSPGSEGVATGTCLGTFDGRRVEVYFADEEAPLGAGALDRSGLFVATFVVPETAALGPQVLRTSCDGRSTFTVRQAALTPGGPSTGDPVVPGGPTSGRPAPPGEEVPPGGTSDEERVVVPDLRGLTEDEAAAALTGTALRLANPSSAEGTVVQQDPLPGTEVPADSPVAVVLAAAVVAEPQAASSSLSPVAVGAPLAVLVVGGAAAAVARLRRRWRERRWVDQQVAVLFGDPTPTYGSFPDATAPGFGVRLEVRRDPAARLQEVRHGDG
ncbi:PASTA domain-containing protein [Blastococcus xanthinilyticus]|uniref:PASTA domain-containing protein n=1 Tax=Blastococcus xanthinilyticus TaxID=1564164 RepID=A0A5S5CVZ3_9ACTN|nr:PASTA domain-containing protein [Blastococcus xanthinilyticus]TYP87960.1 PASTA domain-containing protein [Blastococcus xanthinilyticus]